MATSKYLLLDANVVIEAHAGGYWNILLNQFKIAVPSIIFYDEARYFQSKKAGRTAIDLQPAKDKGLLAVLEATTAQVEAVKAYLTDEFFNAIDRGELEAIALLHTGNFDEYRFCSGDFLANKAMGVMGLGACCISLEEVLAQAGRKIMPQFHFTRDRLRQALAQAMTEQALHRKT